MCFHGGIIVLCDWLFFSVKYNIRDDFSEGSKVQIPLPHYLVLICYIGNSSQL